jgi:hypothetical protein
MLNRVINYMREFGSITTRDAFVDLGCTRLSEYIRQARITLNIKDKWEKTTNRYGERVEYKRYWIEEK